jgi:hypothetical protein
MLPPSSGRSKDGGSMDLWNVSILPQHYTALKPERLKGDLYPEMFIAVFWRLIYAFIDESERFIVIWNILYSLLADSNGKILSVQLDMWDMIFVSFSHSGCCHFSGKSLNKRQIMLIKHQFTAPLWCVYFQFFQINLQVKMLWFSTFWK